MQQTTDHPTTAPESGLEAAALRAEAWADEAFLHNGEDPEQVLGPGTARRRALDDAVERGREPRIRNPLTIQTYAWFARHVGDANRTAYQLVICDEAHTALGEKTSAAIRSFPEPIYIGMTATEQLIAK